MANEKANVMDAVEAKVGKPGGAGCAVAPSGQFDMACWERGPDGMPRQVWSQRAYNGVVQQGIAALGNVYLGGQRVTTNGPFWFLHSVSYNSTYNWAAISTAQVSGYSASLLTAAPASTNATAGSWTHTTNFVFTIAGTQTVSGAGFLFFSSASAATNAANSSDFKLYNIGTFTAAQAVQSNNTLSVTATLSIGTV
jgi:hypothetical protein